MPLVASTEQLLELIRKSSLVDTERLDTFLQSQAGALPDQPRPLAELLIKNGFLTVFQASQLLSGKWRKFLIAGGKYKLLELLGIGGMGKVYLCEHRRMRRLVAVKILPIDRLKEPTSIERFEREARAAGALDHPNIVRAFDLDQDDDLHFLVMEYVDGSTLHEIVKRHGPMAIDRACHYISQAAEGLQYAHEAAGLVHRDVKPGNLLLDRGGTIKLLDMGLARFFHDELSAPLTKRFERSAVLGTAEYLAPEQAVDSSEVDIRADIYSLGVTFYFLLTGRTPFDHGTTTEKLLWHQHKEPEALRSLRKEVPRELESVVARMMAKKPAERFQQPIDVLEALRPWTEQPIEPPSAEEMPRLCPALESIVLSGTSGGLSGSSGSSSSLRLRGRGGPRSSGRLSTTPAATPGRSYTNLWVGAAAFAAGLAALIWWTGRPIDSKSSPPLNIPSTADGKIKPRVDLPGPDVLPAAERNTIFVAAEPRRKLAPGRTDIVSTLGEALALVDSHGRIVVLDGPVEGQLRIDGARLSGLTIEGRGDGGKPILWKPPEGAPPDQPLLTLASADSVRVLGFDFDGERRVDSLVRIEGPAGGAKLERCSLTAALKSAVSLMQFFAPDDRPSVIADCRFTSSRDYLRDENLTCPAAIICIQTTTGSLMVRDCRIEGRFHDGVRIEAPIRAQIQLNRFFGPSGAGATDAVAVRIPETGAVKLVLQSNTSAGFANLLRFDRMPKSPTGCTFQLRSNLLIEGAAFVVANADADVLASRSLFAGSLGNVARPDDGNRGLAVLEKVTVPFGPIDIDPASPSFLRYAKSGDTLALFTSGAGGEPAGVPPVE